MMPLTGFSLESLLRGLLGIVTVLGVAYALSNNRKHIDWKLVASGLALEIVFVLAIFYVPAVGTFFEYGGRIFVKLTSFTQAGVTFLLGPYASMNNGMVFLIHSLPVLIFFTALVSLLYHWGVVQRVIYAFSWGLRKVFRNITGAEGLVVAGNVFLGMCESPVLAKNHLPTMTASELFLVMVSGMGTIAGTVMGAYIGMLGGDSPENQVFFARHLLAASVMAAPGAVVLAKMLFPQTEQVQHVTTFQKEPKAHQSSMEALVEGVATGLKLMVSVAAVLLVFIALVALVNFVFENVIGKYTGLNQWAAQVMGDPTQGFTAEFLIGAVLAPFMWLIGIPTDDLVLVGALIGQKTVLNEFVAYFQLQEWQTVGMFNYAKSVVMATYLLCGFANVGSIGMLLGGLGTLAPEKKPLIASMGFRALAGGALVSILSATVVGMISG